jgi:hypothetical protein
LIASFVWCVSDFGEVLQKIDPRATPGAKIGELRRRRGPSQIVWEFERAISISVSVIN